MLEHALEFTRCDAVMAVSCPWCGSAGASHPSILCIVCLKCWSLASISSTLEARLKRILAHKVSNKMHTRQNIYTKNVRKLFKNFTLDINLSF